MQKISPLLGALALTLCLAGCGDSKAPLSNEIKVGTVDVMRVMEERPETVEVRLEWASQAGSTYLEMSEVTSKQGYAALQQKIQKRSEQWRQRMSKFMEDAIKEMDKATAEVAQERGIELVVVDNPFTRPIKFHEGDDITLDVMLKIQSDG